MRSRRRLVVLLVATTALLASPPAPLAAVEPVVGTPLPAEPPATVLPNLVMDAVAFDLDRDGVRELLTVNAAAVAQGLVAVQAWWVDAEGVAEPSNQVPVRRSASVDEILDSGRGQLGIDRDDMIAVRTDEAAKLVIVERDGQGVALVAAIGSNPDFPVPCCLTVWEIVLGAPAQLDLRLVAETQRFASELISADMDADGTDELLVTEGPFSDTGPTLEVGLLRWTGSRYQRTEITIADLSSCCATILDAGETDGVAGAEVLLSGPLVGPEGSVSAGLHRVSLQGGMPFLERAPLENVSDVHGARALLLESGPSLVTGTEFSTLTLWSWQRGAEAIRLVARTSGGVPAAVFGSGSNARIVVSTGAPPGSVNVLPGDLGGGAGPSAIFGRDLRTGSFGGQFPVDEAPALVPFFGVVPGGLPGIPDAYMFSGRLIQPVSDPIALGEAHDIALLPGLEPIGTVGKEGSWIALLEGFFELEPRPVATSMQRVHEPARLLLASTASVMEPEVDQGNLEPTFLGVAPDPDHPTGLIVGNEAAEAEVSGPPGTTVWWVTRGNAGEVTIGAEGSARIELLEAAGPNAPDGSGATVHFWVATPAGHGYEGSWRIRVYRQPPSLEFEDRDALVNFSPTVSGRTVPGATVTVNGFDVDVAEDGSFEAPVMMGLLPTDVRVVATDPVGNRTEQVVSVVWPVDYRRLPFVPLAVLLTVAAALVLFLRRPDTGPTRRTPDDGATFEEIGG